MVLIEGHGKRRIRWEDEFGVALAPIPETFTQWRIQRSSHEPTYLMHAILTGADTVASYTVILRRQRLWIGVKG